MLVTGIIVTDSLLVIDFLHFNDSDVNKLAKHRPAGGQVDRQAGRQTAERQADRKSE